MVKYKKEDNHNKSRNLSKNKGNRKNKEDDRNLSFSGFRKIKDILSNSFSEIYRLRFLIMISFIAILFTSIISFHVNPKNEVFEKTIDTLKGYANDLSEGSFFQVASFIFLNNLKASFLMMCLGLIPFFPLLVNVSNGIIIGLVLRAKVDATSNLFMIFALLPHGIFEIPAICISTALGISISLKIFNADKGNKDKSMREVILSNIIVFIAIVIPLLVIAAIIETFVFRMRL